MMQINSMNAINKKAILIFYLSGLLLIPTALLILPADYFDSGQSVCLSVLLFNKTCWGCGMTRAVQHFIHFDFATAYSFNKASFIVFPFMIFIWLAEVIHSYKKIRKPNDEEQYVVLLSGVVNILFKIKQIRKSKAPIGFILGIISVVFSIVILLAVVIATLYTKH
jgi:uncharacterized membrane protein HdeD (DUF308 family)